MISFHVSSCQISLNVLLDGDVTDKVVITIAILFFLCIHTKVHIVLKKWSQLEPSLKKVEYRNLLITNSNQN